MYNFSSLSRALVDQQLNVYNIRILQNEACFALDRAADVRRPQYSIAKSFTAVAAGMAVREKKFSLDASAADYFADKLPQDQRDKLARIHARHLLTMSSGLEPLPFLTSDREALARAGVTDWVELCCRQPAAHMPGTRFAYSNADVFLLSAMLQEAVGQSVKEYLTPRLFEPLGIRHVHWEASPLGRTLGCTGLHLTTEELSRFGQLLLQKGCWKGKRLVDEGWLSACTSRQIETTGSRDFEMGYGYLFWLSTHCAYRAEGRHGQFCLVLPLKNTVIAINSNEPNAQGILDCLWDTVYPYL